MSRQLHIAQDALFHRILDDSLPVDVATLTQALLRGRRFIRTVNEEEIS